MTELKREKTFTHNDRELVVRALQTDDGWKVEVFENLQPATNVVYSVSYIVATDAGVGDYPVDLVENLMGIAMSDVEQGIVKLL